MKISSVCAFTGKQIFDSIELAKEAAKEASQKTGEDIRNYRCPFCCKPHIGHYKTWQQRAKEREAKEAEAAKAFREALKLNDLWQDPHELDYDEMEDGTPLCVNCGFGPGSPEWEELHI